MGKKNFTLQWKKSHGRVKWFEDVLGKGFGKMLMKRGMFFYRAVLGEAFNETQNDIFIALCRFRNRRSLITFALV